MINDLNEYIEFLVKKRQEEVSKREEYSIENLIKDIKTVTEEVFEFSKQDMPKDSVKKYLSKGCQIIHEWYNLFQDLNEEESKGLKAFYKLLEENRYLFDNKNTFLEHMSLN